VQGSVGINRIRGKDPGGGSGLLCDAVMCSCDHGKVDVCGQRHIPGHLLPEDEASVVATNVRASGSDGVGMLGGSYAATAGRND